MKFKVLIFPFFVFILSNFALANPLTIEFEKEQYYSGETVQGKLFIDESVQGEIKTTDFHLEINNTIINVFANETEIIIITHCAVVS